MNPRVLLVEDNPTDEKLALRAFARSGVTIEIAVARDGADALARLLGGGAMPQVVLLDLKLPRVDGLEVLRRLRADARTKLLPVVVLTASKEEEDLARAYALGANAYVRKPLDFNEFAETARTLLRFWVTLNETAPVR